MTEVLLFNQYFTSRKESPALISATLPINLLCLASFLKKSGINCKIYELGIFDFDKIVIENDRIRCGIPDNEIIDIIKTEEPKIIGLGCMYSIHYRDVVMIARLIKTVNPFIKIVLGGNHASVFKEIILKEQSFDFIVYGEGEITFFELCKAVLSDKKDFLNIKGLSFRDYNNNTVTTPQRELIEGINSLPMIDYSLVEIKKYAVPSVKSPYVMRTPYLGIVSSRGCPGDCIFCTVKAVWGRTWRGKNAKQTVDEIELLNSEYGVKEFAFLDDSASLDKKRWHDICDEIIRRKLDIRWTTPNGIAHWTLDKPTLKKMKQSGCYRITFGIESGNEDTRKFIRKSYPLSQAKELIQYANKIGMWTICTNIVGFPFETKKSINDTLEFAKKCGTDFATFYLLSPNLTSDVYNYFEKEGLLNFSSVIKDNKFDLEDYENMIKALSDGGFPTKCFTAKELKKIQIKAYKSFIIYRAMTYLNPAWLLKKIHSIEDANYTLKLLYNGLKILIRSSYKITTKGLLYKDGGRNKIFR